MFKFIIITGHVIVTIITACGVDNGACSFDTSAYTGLGLTDANIATLGSICPNINFGACETEN